MKGTVFMQVSPELGRLAAGLVRSQSEAFAPEAMSDKLAAFDALLSEEGAFWGMVAMVVLGAASWAGMGWMWWKNRNRDLAKWSQLSHYLETGKGRAGALVELEQIEVLSNLLFSEANLAHNDWFQLSPSEKQVARGILHDVPAQVLADELMCTPSHIYNLRSSIRKKWGIESNQALRQAIAERMPKER